MTRTAVLTVLAATVFGAMPVQAQTGTVFMRRPLPDTKSTNSSSPTQTEQTLVVPDPAVKLCDTGLNAQKPVLTAVKWIENGWKAASSAPATCSKQEMDFGCQATYTCKIEGVDQTFVSEAPDSTCENFQGTVSYPAGIKETAPIIGKPIQEQVAWAAARLKMAAAMGWQNQGSMDAIKSMPWIRSITYENYWHGNDRGEWGFGPYMAVYIQDQSAANNGGVMYGFGEVCAAMSASGKNCTNYGASGTHIVYSFR